MYRNTIVVVATLTLFGCTGAGQKLPEKRNIQNSKVVNASYDETWNTVVEFFAVNNTPLEKVEKEDGLITSARHLRSRNELDCGEATGQISWASAKMENVGGNVNVVVRAVGKEQTKVIISVFGRGEIHIRNAYGNSLSAQEAACVSTGVLEKSLFSYLENI